MAGKGWVEQQGKLEDLSQALSIASLINDHAIGLELETWRKEQYSREASAMDHGLKIT